MRPSNARGLAATLVLALGAVGCAEGPRELGRLKIALYLPDPVDVGWLVSGDRVTRPLQITSFAKGRVRITGLRPVEPLPEGLTLSVDANVDLRPGASAELQLELLATDEAPEDMAVLLELQVEGIPEGDARLPRTTFRARVTRSGLVAEPNPLVLGPVDFLNSVEGSVSIRNLRSRPVELYARRHDGVRAQYEENVAVGSFGSLPRVDADGRIGTLEARGTLDVPLSYTAPAGAVEAKEQAVWWVRTCPDLPAGSEACGLRMVVQGVPDREAPQLALIPADGAHFGPVPLGEEVEMRIYLSNGGTRPLELSDVRLMGEGSFMVERGTTTVLGGTSEPVLLRFRPRSTREVTGTLVIESNDPVHPKMEVRVSGAGVLLPPCRFEVDPESVDFGVVEVGASRTERMVMTNVGDRDCVAFDPRVEPAAGTPEGAFDLVGDVRASRTLPPGGTLELSAVFRPAIPGAQSATFSLRTTGEQLEVHLFGATPGAGGVYCTAPSRTERDRPVTVTALSRTGTIVDYRWDVTSAPAPSSWSFLPDASSGLSVQLLPKALGSYEVRATLTTESGELHACTVDVEARSSGVTATLTWDGEGDLDLHLHRGTQTPWFSDDDCYFDNLTPVWVPLEDPGAGGNPSLDRDDTSGEGPEHIRILTPELGVPYTLGVSHFEGAAGRTARVILRCGRSELKLDTSSRPFGGHETGECTGNDFWEVATFVMTAADECTVTPSDTYRSTRDACLSY